MSRDDALLMISPRLYELLRKLFVRFRCWAPQTGYPRASAGMATGGSVSYESFGEWEDEQDSEAVWVLEAAFDGLNPAERTVIEQLVGVLPWVFQARAGVLESAIAKLERKMRGIGVE